MEEGEVGKGVRKHCELIRELDPDSPITVGHELSSQMDTTSDLVDVLSFQDYMPTRSKMQAAEYCINILESCKLVPMWDSLSSQLCRYRGQKSEERDEWEIQKFAYECAQWVKEIFLIL